MDNSIININLHGAEEFIKGLNQLKDIYNFDICEGGVDIIVKKSSINKTVDNTIYYSNKLQFFRQFIYLLYNLRNNTVMNEVTNIPYNKICAMLDVSRNAVINVETLKKWISYMAGFGFNCLMLYMEDTYEVKDYPYMGYLRGKYSIDELKEIDAFADNLGIEVIACIQTLGHMGKYLRWDNSLRDSSDVLLADDENTYLFIEKCIESISKSLKSEYIHIGMDEAFSMGLGKYLDKHGYCDRVELFTRHLNRVKKICKKYNKKPIIWSDMYFRLGSKTRDYYDLDCDFSNVRDVPDVDMVYWDYYSVDYERYDKIIKAHKELSNSIWFAGGIWTWGLMTHAFSKTSAVTEVALEACKANGIKNVIATLWGDGGAMCPIFATLNGMALWSSQIYYGNSDMANKIFNIVVDDEINKFNEIENLDNPSSIIKLNYNITDQVQSCVASSLLWQDILLGLLDYDYKNINFTEYYTHCAKVYSQYVPGKFEELFDYYKHLAETLSIKGDIGKSIMSSYKKKDRNALKIISSSKLPELKEKLYSLKSSHRKLWNKYNKPFGFEIMDIRYGGVISRVDSTIMTINDYLDGYTDEIVELEVGRLPYYHDYIDNTTGLVCEWVYTATISTCSL